MVQYPCVEIYPKQQDYTSGTLRAIFQKDSLWRSGSEGKANITFGSQRCSGCSPEQAWSYVGTQINNSWGPSMNLGFVDPPYKDFTFNGQKYPYSDFKNATRNYCTGDFLTCSSGWVPGATVIHEFCHALGMLHEHQNNLFNSNAIKLNIRAVINHYLRTGMTEQDAYNNTITRYSCETGDCQYEGSRYDPNSIMLYALPDAWVIGTNPTKPNFKLSELDKKWLQKQYPIENRNMPRLVFQFTDVNEPKWKEAWVCKNVIETLAPIVGVKFTFIGMDGSVIKTSPVEYINLELPIFETDKPKEIETQKPLPITRFIRRCETRCNNRRCTRRCYWTPYLEQKPARQLAIENFTDNTNNETFTNNEQKLNTGAIVAIVLIVLLVFFMIFMSKPCKKKCRK